MPRRGTLAEQGVADGFNRDDGDVVEALCAKLETLPAIEQAKGILMATHPLTPGEAFARLVETSQRCNVKLRDLAAALVADTVEAGSARAPRDLSLAAVGQRCAAARNGAASTTDARASRSGGPAARAAGGDIVSAERLGR